MVARIRLPGVRFEARTPTADEALPRMDIAVFVGFAASGPLHAPVAVEDPARFAAVFGDDLPLAWDHERGERVCAHLAPAVRAFFRNGGRRCWVVRVAGPGAVANRFAIPGLCALGPGGALAPAYARARSPGSWSDQLQVAAALHSTPLTVLSVAPDGGWVDLPPAAAGLVAPADLLRVSFSGTGFVLFALVDGLESRSPGSPGASAVRVMASLARWFLAAAAASPPGSPPEAAGALIALPGPPTLPAGAAPVGERLSLDLVVRRGRATPQRLGGLGFAPGHPRYWAALPDDDELFVATPLGALPPDPRYDLLRREAAAAAFPLAGVGAGGVFLPLRVGVLPGAFQGPEPAADTPLVRDGLDSFGPQLFLDAELADVRLDTLAGAADFLRYQSPRPRRLLGIHAAMALEEAALIAVPDALHAGWRLVEPDPAPPPDEPDPLPRPEWWHFLDCEQAEPAAALAAPVFSGFAGATGGLPAPALARLDRPPRPGVVALGWGEARPGAIYILEEARAASFAGAAEAYRGPGRRASLLGRTPGDYFYRVRAEAGGAASTWSGGLAVRVAAGTIPLTRERRGDKFLACETGITAAPEFLAAPAPGLAGSYELGWSAAGGEARYVLEEATAPDWGDAAVIYSGPATALPIYGRGPGAYYYRVRVELIGRRSFAVSPTPPRAECGAGEDEAQVDILAWPSTGYPGEEFAVEERSGPGLFERRVIYSGPARRISVDRQAGRSYSVLARFVTARSDWSAGVTAAVEPPGRWALPPVDERSAETALAVQRAVLRMCAARGDLLAALALPEGLREAEALAYLADLTMPGAPALAYRRDAASPPAWIDVPAIGAGEAVALSYGAAYHPWLVGREETRPELLRRTPPDGAICGQMARRALARGAWVAPANSPLAQVAALTPPIARERRLELFAAQLNLIRHEPRGFVALSADTLSGDPELRPINVRRTLMLLRRLALRYGHAFSFEPSGPELRRLARADFEAILDRLFVAGAFAGRVPAEAYQVVVDDRPLAADAARLLIELRVAPARPMVFLTVRLVRRGEAVRVIEGV